MVAKPCTIILADTGENNPYPFGMTWTEDGYAHRSSDGRNLADFIGNYALNSDLDNMLDVLF